MPWSGTESPFCVVLGNHDAEQDLARTEIARIVTSYDGSLNRLADNGELADVELTVAGRGSDRPAWVFYCLDSHDYSTIEGIDGYGWFLPGQVEWLRACCTARTEANGGRPLPSLAFFHIALPEYVAAWRNPDNSHIGRAAEDECPGVLNTGMFSAMAATGSVVGTFVGHDHDIDYLVAEKGICLGYGRFSGDNTTYNNLRPGVRMLVLTEGARGFETWIREDDGRMVDHARFEGVGSRKSRWSDEDRCGFGRHERSCRTGGRRTHRAPVVGTLQGRPFRRGGARAHRFAHRAADGSRGGVHRDRGAVGRRCRPGHRLQRRGHPLVARGAPQGAFRGAFRHTGARQ